MDYTPYINLLKSKLDDYRFNHSLCVAKESFRLAEKYGYDTTKAYLAGLLHDITKNESREFHLNYIKEFDIILTDIELASDSLLHAISGSLFVKHELKIEDEDIISAIRYHTTAKGGMSLLEKIVYVSDFTSSDRSYPDIDKMRAEASKSLENAIVYAVSYTVNRLIGKNRPVHPDAIAAYNDTIMTLNKSEEIS